MKKKKVIAFKENKPRKTKIVTLSNGEKIMERYHSDVGSKPIYRPIVADPELATEPNDEYSKMKYPPPKKNKIFREKWVKFVKSLASRDGFKEAHLEALEILCDLYVEYEELGRVLRVEGRTYEKVSRWGAVKAMHPAIHEQGRVRASIRSYTLGLDLFPKKDFSEGADGEEEEWE
jgi:phage terminase small subunit